MTLQEIFDALTQGELSQLSIAGSPNGAITEDAYPRMVMNVNLALTALYKRFPLKLGKLLLQLDADIPVYSLTAPYAVSTKRSKAPSRYIQDTFPYDAFKDDLLKVESVMAESGAKLGLNDAADKWSVTTPSFNRLAVPEAILAQSTDLPEKLHTDTLEVTYRASHPKLAVTLGFFDPARVEVELPPAYLQALLYFIAARCYNPMGINVQDASAPRWFQLYEAECQRLVTENLGIDQGQSNERFRDNGWV